MDVKAIAKEVRISPIRLRLMVDLVRGKNVNEAINILTNYNSKSAKVVLKVVNSAVANAVNNNNLNADNLYVKDIRIDKFYHRRSHVTVVVSER